MKKLSGFSLMEMMIVLLIVSIIAGATAPMINKKLVTAASEKSPWVWIGQGTNDIGYNVLGGNKTAAIGTMEIKGNIKPRLYIESDSQHPSSIGLKYKDDNTIAWNIATTGSSFTITPYPTDHTDLSYSVDPSTNAIAIGGIAKKDATAVGYSATASGEHSIALGRGDANGTKSIAIGSFGDDGSVTEASEGYSIAIGAGTNAKKIDTIAIGRGTDALADYSIAMGYGATAGSFLKSVQSGVNAIAIGYNAKAIGELKSINDAKSATSAIAIGHNSEVKGGYGIAIGGGNTSGPTQTRSWNSSSIAIGRGTDALAQNSIAIGYNAVAGTEENQSETSAIAIGHNSKATGEYGIAIGGGNTSGPTQTRSWNSSSIAIGRGTDALGENSIAMGYNAAAAAYDANGNELSTQPESAIAIGYGAKATCDSSTAIGDGAQAKHNNSVAIGPGAVTNASNQIVLGNADTTVYIPGNLYVGKKSLLGTSNLEDDASNVYIRFGAINPDKLTQLRADSAGDSNIYVKLNSGTTLGFGPDGYASDRRLKNVGKAFKGGLEEIKKLEVFNYTFKKDKSKTPRVGVMAQDLEKIFPSAVTKGEDGFLRIRMEDMFYALVNAVKELDTKFDLLAQKQKKIDELEDKVSKLELENKEFAKRLLELEKKIK